MAPKWAPEWAASSQLILARASKPGVRPCEHHKPPRTATDERGRIGNLEFVNDFYEPVLSCPDSFDYRDSFMIAAYGIDR